MTLIFSLFAQIDIRKFSENSSKLNPLGNGEINFDDFRPTIKIS